MTNFKEDLNPFRKESLISEKEVKTPIKSYPCDNSYRVVGIDSSQSLDK